ncbi:MAG: uroporphyrinogen-III synthase [Byssovorax sp.]
MDPVSSAASNGDPGAEPRAEGRGFEGRAVVFFESRRAAEMGSLIERHGGVPVSAPALREVVLDQNEDALAFARSLAASAFDVVVLMTGVGTRALIEEIAPVLDRAAFAAALGAVQVIARGPKPASVLRELGLRSFTQVPAPNTWREVLAALQSLGPLAAKRVAVQEHGAPSTELYAALREAGAALTTVPVYRWALPEDTTPLRAGLRALAEEKAKVALFTSRSQVEHAFAVAAEEGIEAPLRDALRRGVVGSIGPVCSEALRAEGVEPDMEPSVARMGQLVKECAASTARMLEAKRS